MTEDQRNKIIRNLYRRPGWIKKWQADGMIKYGSNSAGNWILLGNDRIPVGYQGQCAKIHERFVNQLLLDMYIESDRRLPDQDLSAFNPTAKDYPRMYNPDRHYFARLFQGTSNRIKFAWTDSNALIFDDKYYIADDGHVVGWDADKYTAVKLPKGQLVSQLDYELMKMAKELKSKLKSGSYTFFPSQEATTEEFTVKEAVKMLSKYHEDDDDCDSNEYAEAMDEMLRKDKGEPDTEADRSVKDIYIESYDFKDATYN